MQRRTSAVVRTAPERRGYPAALSAPARLVDIEREQGLPGPRATGT
ncbi:hypothetical protein ACIBI9_60250 [Nonomuraea sp. NPDC050451]